MALTPKQEAFVAEYLVDLNATQAAIRAGYSEKTAGSIGHENLQKPEISRAIAEAFEARKKRVELEADYVLLGLQEVAERCMQRAPVMVFDRGTRRMVQAQDSEGRDLWQFDSTGANRALELLGKHLQLFTDKVQHSGSVGGVVVIPAAPGTAEWEALAKDSQARLTEAASAASAPDGG